jgi:hypothetical protein
VAIGRQAEIGVGVGVSRDRSDVSIGKGSEEDLSWAP